MVNLFKSPRTGRAKAAAKGNAGYDNPRENIDPQIKTHALNANQLHLANTASGSNYYPLIIEDQSLFGNCVKLPMLSENHRPSIKWIDFTSKHNVATLQAHNKNSAGVTHNHFSIYTNDAADIGRNRFSIDFATDDPDIECGPLGTFVIRSTDGQNERRKNRNISDDALDVGLGQLVDDGNTYTLSGNVCRLRNSDVETLGTINNTADVLLIEQWGDTGKGINIDLKSTGVGIDISGANTSINASGIISGAGGYFSGNVGIGTAAPITKLHVWGGAGDSAPVAGTDIMAIENSDHTYINIIGKSDKNTGFIFSDDSRGTGYVYYDHRVPGLRFGASVERMRILASNGNVGIGTTTPSKKLEVNGTISGSGVYSSAGFNGTGAYTNFTIVGGIITAAS